MALTPDEAKALLAFAAEGTSDGVLCLDEAGRVHYANPTAARTLGLAVSELTSKDIFSLAPEMNPALWKELQKEIRRNNSFGFEFTLQAVPGRTVQVEVSARLLQPAERELLCVFFRDVEERKRLQNLEQEFVSTASHELRSPMTIIREGISQVYEGLRGEVNDSQKRSLTIALSGIDRLSRIIDELLDMSKIEAGKVALRRSRIDLAALAREVGSTFQGQAADRGLDLRVTTPAGPVMLFADHDRLIQVFTNFISNAFKFTEKGRIEIDVAAREGEVECAVVDSGMGLASGDAEKIFNKFEQLGQTSVTGEKGTGLGLSISRGIVELHKGRIWAESAGVGKGTRIAFTLPRLSGRDVFSEQLGPVLGEVARRGGSLSTVVFRIENLGTEPLPDKQIAAILAGLETLVRRQSGRESDLLTIDSDRVYFALQSTVKREALRVAERIVDAFEETLAREKVKTPLRMTYKITSFPEEAAEEDRYLEKVFNSRAA